VEVSVLGGELEGTDLLPVETLEALEDGVLVELAEVGAAPRCGRARVCRIPVAYGG